jgi:hypothetical protein
MARSPPPIGSELMMRVPWPARPEPADPRAQRVLEWTDVACYVISRAAWIGALLQLVAHGPAALHAL